MQLKAMPARPEMKIKSASRDTQPVVLTIAGFDPSSGAGITADLKVFAAHGLYGVAAITALTVQSTAGVRRVEPVSAALLSETLACLAADLPIAGIKIGMLATAANVDAVAAFLGTLPPVDGQRPVVLDPVLRSTSGHALLDPSGVERLRTRLLPLVSCITPNSVEVLSLCGKAPAGTIAAQPERAVAEVAATRLAQQFPELGIVVTGGHLDAPDDLVMAPGMPGIWLRGEWVDTPATHGTGCGYSSALLCALVAGRSLIDAASAAKRYVSDALRAATPRGKGGGSMHHLHRFSPHALAVSAAERGADEPEGKERE